MDARPDGALRLFFGVPLAPEARRRLADAGRRLAASGWRPADEVALHVTLRFLGDTAAALLPDLAAATRTAAAAEEPFDVHLVSLAGIPDARRARVAAARAEEGAGQLRRLAAAVAEALRPLGIAPERRPFLAHVTVARSGAVERPLRPLPLDVSFRAERLVLWQSRLARPHAVYEAWAEAPLGAGRPPA